jgi:hypothetical protein
MKAFFFSGAIAAVLYLADQQFAQGKYTHAVGRMANEIRHAFR